MAEKRTKPTTMRLSVTESKNLAHAMEKAGFRSMPDFVVTMADLINSGKVSQQINEYRSIL